MSSAGSPHLIRFLRPLIALAALLALTPLLACKSDPPKPRNLLILSVDTLRADALGIAGYEPARTPHLDALAESGTYFPHAITPIPRTTPGLASLLTGLSPRHHGSRDVGDAIAEVPTLAEMLAEHGYTTLAVSSNHSAGPKQGFDRGFQRFVAGEDLQDLYDGELYRDLTDVPPTKTGWATATTDQALELASELSEGDDFFLWVFYFDPHFLYRPPSPWQDEIEAEACWQLYEEWQNRRDEAGQVFSDIGGVASAAAEACRALYDAEIAFTDHEIGRLLASLEEAGLLEDTLIVFTSDHGENFGEGGLYFEHGSNAHDAALRVPLIFSGPGVAESRRVEKGASLTDLAPTVLSLLAIPDDGRPRFDGIDLSEQLSPEREPGRSARPRILFAESATSIFNEATELVTTGRTWWRVCINGERFTLCEIPSEAPGVYQLFDHEADPGLERNLASQHPEVAADLLAAWSHWPPETARERVAWTPQFKLVDRPLLDGSYRRSLYHLESDPQEIVDVSASYPKVLRELGKALDRWAADLPALPEREENPELEETLRSLGYLP